MILGDVCAIRSGITLRKRMPNPPTGGVLAIQPGDLTPAGDFLPRVPTRITVPTLSTHRLSRSEVVFRSRGPYWTAWTPPNGAEPLVAVAPLFILSPADDIDPHYLAWSLRRPHAQRYFDSESVGSNVQMISKSALARTPLELPPLSIQRAIATAADLAQHERALSARLVDLRHDRIAADLDALARADYRSTL